jgi:hypothetical protein
VLQIADHEPPSRGEEFFRPLSAKAILLRPGIEEGTPHHALRHPCYHREDVVGTWSKAEDDAVMAKLAMVQEKLARQGRLGPVARLLPTTAATTLRKDSEPPLVIDGPFAKTKEQLLGFYVIDCASLDEALETAQDLGRANPGGTYEIRPIGIFRPGTVLGSKTENAAT